MFLALGRKAEGQVLDLDMWQHLQDKSMKKNVKNKEASILRVKVEGSELNNKNNNKSLSEVFISRT